METISENTRSSRRVLLAGFTSLMMLGLSGCTSTGPNGNGDVIFASGKSHSFQGTGPKETERFDLDEGLMRISYESSSEDVFTTGLVDMDGDTSGPYIDERNLTNNTTKAGELMNIVNGGSYLIDVDVEGEWSLEISQPGARRDEVAELPFEESGEMPASYGPIKLDEDAQIRASHEGDGVFSVGSMTVDGRWDVPINDGGQIESTTRPFRDSGIAWINVVGTNNWSIRIE